jgi:outer membrane protein TolC
LALDLNQIALQYETSLRLAETSRESLNAMQAEYKAGRVTFLDIITSLNDFAASQDSVYGVYFDLLYKAHEHDFYSGRLFETIFEK